MSKINFFSASRNFSDEVADFMFKSVWRSEYKLELEEAISKELSAIAGLENCKGSAIMTEEQVNSAIEERNAFIETYKDAYENVVKDWTRITYSAPAKTLYKGYKSATSEEAVADAFKEFLKAYGLEVEADNEFVVELCSAVSGDSGRTNIKQVVQTGKWAVSKRSQSEFLKIVYRRLADAMISAGTIRLKGDFTIKSASEEYLFEVEIPELTRIKYARKAKKDNK